MKNTACLSIIAVLAAMAAAAPAAAAECTEALQRRIDAASAAGGGRVVLEAGEYPVRTVFLKSGVTLELRKGARLCAATPDSGLYSTVVEEANGGFDRIYGAEARALIGANGATNIAIVGEGVIDGKGSLVFDPAHDEKNCRGRYRTVHFYRCRDIRIEGVSMVDSARWTCFLQECEDIVVRKVKLHALGAWHADGFDLDVKRCLIEDCDIDVYDDAICPKSENPDFICEDIEVRNCRLRSQCHHIKLGTSVYGGIRNVHIHDCVCEGCEENPCSRALLANQKTQIAGWDKRDVAARCGILIGSVDGAFVENVRIKDVTFSACCQTPLVIRAADRRRGKNGAKSVLRDITLENISFAGSLSWLASSITGVPGIRPERILLRNVKTTVKGGCPADMASAAVPEAEKKYPENRMFGTMTPLPAYGYFVRHADDVRFENCTLGSAAPEVRPPVCVEDSTRVTAEGCSFDLPGKTGVGFVGRRAFVRGEADAAVRLAFRGVPAGRVATVEQLGADGSVVKRTELAVPAPGADGKAVVSCPVETRITTGWHELRVRFGAEERVLRVGIGPLHADRMTTLIWIGYYVEKPWKVKSFGFTHLYDLGDSDGHKSDELTPAQRIDHLDHALANGVEVIRSLATAPMEDQRKYDRLDRSGKNQVRGKKKRIPIEVSHPAVRERFAEQTRRTVAELGDHPAFAGILPCSELRQATTFPSFNTEHERYRRETGRDVPQEVVKQVFAEKDAEARYPDGIVPDDDPVLAYYRWFWKGGDGWPDYVGAAADVCRETVRRRDFFTFWDPAVRCPPIWGSGGGVDMLNQWVYANPEPMNVAAPAEEILAMAAGRPGQQPAIMTQLICYRARMAPTNVPVAKMPPGLLKHPRADFPTIPPDALQEATWSMIAKPVKAIMYHGWRTVCETGRETGYCYTNPESAKRLKHLLNDVVAPLGPMLKHLGREEPPVAVLESFTSCVMGAPFSWGWEAQPITMLQRARLDPRVVYEETLLRDGFDGIRVLYAPQCRFLTPTIIAKLREFQAKGGILVADAKLPPALKANIVLPEIIYRRPPVADHIEEMERQIAAESRESHTAAATRRVKTDMIAVSEKVRAALKGRYSPRVDSSSAEIVTYSRRWQATDYVFAINDRRTFGDYVGQWGLIMEKGLAMSGAVTLEDPGREVKAVYELSRGGEAAFTHEGGRAVVPVEYATNDGRLFVFLRERIAALKVTSPEKVDAAGRVKVRLEVRGASGRPVAAILPVEIRLYDAAGREIDGAGYLAAKDGVAEVEFMTNRDDAKGDYRLVCRDRASGLVSEKTIAGAASLRPRAESRGEKAK